MANNLARVFLGNGNNTEKKAYVWNTLNGVVFAAQSVLMLMIITRVSDLATAGVFSIAYSTASMLMNMGLYGMRYFQVSDYDRIYSFREYVTSRKVTTWAMIIVGAGYMLVMALTGQYTAEKAAIVMLMTVFKALDAIEDVYTADYQNCGRLDAGAKMVTIRLLFSLVVFGAALMITRSLLVTLAITNILSYGYVIVAVKVMAPHFKKEEETKERGKVKKLLLVCFPLFAAQFLSLYLTNAPKYSIDTLLSEEIQACYGFLSMPVFIVGLLSNFIFQPIITNMSEAWSEGRYGDLRKIVIRQTGIIGMLAAAMLIGGYFLGLPVLSWLYHTDLSGYLPELMILLAGGGLMALSRYFVTVVTVMRRQKMITVGYLVTSVAALLLSNAVVRQYGITGACVVYTGSMLLLTVILVVIAVIFTRGGGGSFWQGQRENDTL